MNIQDMSDRELDEYLAFLAKEIQRIMHEHMDTLPVLQDTMRAVAVELGKRSPV